MSESREEKRARLKPLYDAYMAAKEAADGCEEAAKSFRRDARELYNKIMKELGGKPR